MARYTGPIQKKLRSLGLDTYGAYGTRKEKRVNQTFGRRRRTSAYGLQLKEKQKAKFHLQEPVMEPNLYKTKSLFFLVVMVL